MGLGVAFAGRRGGGCWLVCEKLWGVEKGRDICLCVKMVVWGRGGKHLGPEGRRGLNS